MRGRNRKGPNPLTRSYESNGPDVKIRGTAQHIAEKYSQLARDAQASGDPIAAENYFQHAEHYFRIIAAAQAQFQQTYGGGQRPFDEEREEGESEEAATYGYGQPQPAVYELGAPQPDVRGGQGFAQGEDEGFVPRQEQRQEPRQDYQREPRGGDRNFGDRPYQERQGRAFQERGERRPFHDRQDRPERPERRERFRNGERRQQQGGFQPTAAAEGSEEAAQAALPAFLTTPVRTPIAVDNAPEPAEVPATVAAPAVEEAEATPRPRRRRTTRTRAATAENGDSPAVDAGVPAGE
ncbi:DUF4167 domain-containing protein [Chelatococcus albus]|nr:DUF4167 domain-containing protein [Chelatococcus sp. SYSU_G07232]